MKTHYRYVHIHGDLDALAKPVTYAGLVYLLFAFLSLFFWIRGLKRAGVLGPTRGNFSQLNEAPASPRASGAGAEGSSAGFQ